MRAYWLNFSAITICCLNYLIPASAHKSNFVCVILRKSQLITRFPVITSFPVMTILFYFPSTEASLRVKFSRCHCCYSPSCLFLTGLWSRVTDWWRQRKNKLTASHGQRSTWVQEHLIHHNLSSDVGNKYQFSPGVRCHPDVCPDVSRAANCFKAGELYKKVSYPKNIARSCASPKRQNK